MPQIFTSLDCRHLASVFAPEQLILVHPQNRDCIKGLCAKYITKKYTRKALKDCCLKSWSKVYIIVLDTSSVIDRIPEVAEALFQCRTEHMASAVLWVFSPGPAKPSLCLWSPTWTTTHAALHISGVPRAKWIPLALMHHHLADYVLLPSNTC